MTDGVRLGASFLGNDRCRFLVYAPLADTVEVRILSPREQVRPLSRDERGYHQGVLEEVAPGSLYVYRLDGKMERPDPASRFQPLDSLKDLGVTAIELMHLCIHGHFYQPPRIRQE